MEKSGKRGKIPPQDWPQIITRYQAGETLASIARTYDCSPPAISYIVSRSRARNAAAEAQGAVPPQEPQLVKSHSAGTPPVGTPSAATPLSEFTETDSPPAASALAAAVPGVAAISGERSDTPKQSDELRLFVDEPPSAAVVRRDPAHHGEGIAAERQKQGPHDPQPSGNGNATRSFAPAAAPPPNGEPRRTLHLSLPGSDVSHRQEPQPQPHEPQAPAIPGVGERAMPPQTGAHSGTGAGARYGIGPYAPAGNGAPMRSAQEPQAAKNGGTFIDHALRERVDGDIAAFLAAFDAALDHDTAESRAGLREATDRLLRAGARTRIELERLEARVPLVPREKSGQEARAFRPR
jgi:hypothetical protein